MDFRNGPQSGTGYAVRREDVLVPDSQNMIANKTGPVQYSIYQYSDVATRLSGQTSIFGGVFFVSKSFGNCETL